MYSVHLSLRPIPDTISPPALAVTLMYSVYAVRHRYLLVRSHQQHLSHRPIPGTITPPALAVTLMYSGRARCRTPIQPHYSSLLYRSATCCGCSDDRFSYHLLRRISVQTVVECRTDLITPCSGNRSPHRIRSRNPVFCG